VGHVRGRTCISFQLCAESVDTEVETQSEQCLSDQPFVSVLATDRAVKLVRTNCAIRREEQCDLVGFDAAYRCSQDDTGLSLRLAGTGHRAVVAPLPEVHHTSAAPDGLFDIARSTARFLRRRHGAGSANLVEPMYQRDRDRFLRHLVAGTSEPRDISRLLAALVADWQAGLSEELTRLKAKTAPAPGVCPSRPNPLGITCAPRASLV